MKISSLLSRIYFRPFFNVGGVRQGAPNDEIFGIMVKRHLRRELFFFF
jgi:hypothetical protein